MKKICILLLTVLMSFFCFSSCAIPADWRDPVFKACAESADSIEGDSYYAVLKKDMSFSKISNYVLTSSYQGPMQIVLDSEFSWLDYFCSAICGYNSEYALPFKIEGNNLVLTDDFYIKLSSSFKSYTNSSYVYTVAFVTQTPSTCYTASVTVDIVTVYGSEDGYNEGWHAGYIEGYDAAQTDSEVLNSVIPEFVYAIFNAPIDILRDVFSFEIFGVNVAGVVMFVLTALVVLFVIRRFK